MTVCVMGGIPYLDVNFSEAQGLATEVSKEAKTKLLHKDLSAMTSNIKNQFTCVWLKLQSQNKGELFVYIFYHHFQK